jgi:hypothetical protein
MTGVDIIGDIHGHAEALERLLDVLGLLKLPGASGALQRRRAPRTNRRGEKPIHEAESRQCASELSHNEHRNVDRRNPGKVVR